MPSPSSPRVERASKLAYYFGFVYFLVLFINFLSAYNFHSLQKDDKARQLRSLEKTKGFSSSSPVVVLDKDESSQFEYASSAQDNEPDATSFSKDSNENNFVEKNPSALGNDSIIGSKQMDVVSKTSSDSSVPSEQEEETPEEATTHTEEEKAVLSTFSRPKTTKASSLSVEDSMKSPTSSPYAYVYIIGSIHEDRKSYKGFFYDILVSVQMLRKLGSTADVWVWAQLSPDSKLDDIPAEDKRLLTAMDIHLEYLEKPKKESFAQIMLEKFRILQMTNYRRVIYLDSDTMPLTNLDYLFHLSDDGSSAPVLQPNFIMASRGEPCQGGLFMMEPKVGAWEELQGIIVKQRESGKNLPYPHFDWYNGWGHNFVESGDFWEAINRNATRWGYHGGHSDQGLLHYYVKYVRQDASIAIGGRLQTWGKGTGDKKQPHKIRETYNELEKYSQAPAVFQHHCDTTEPEMPEYCGSPYRDFAHFMGSRKPWQYGQKNPYYRRKRSTANTYQAYQLWFKILEEINVKYNMGLDVFHWDDAHMHEMKDSPLGYKPEFRDNAHLVHQHSGESGNNDINNALHNQEESDSLGEEDTQLEHPSLEQENNELGALEEGIEVNPRAKKVQVEASPLEQESTKAVGGTTNTSTLPEDSVIFSSSSPYAYVYIIGSIHEERKSYKGFFYDILVSVQMLRKLGSTADVWVWAQLSPDSSLDDIPAEDKRLLTALDIHLEYLEKPKKESFAQIMLEKFRILQMTNYRRVIYLDSDTMPLTNLDYLFHLSDDGSSAPVLQPNLIMASRGEPCQGGLFMMEPKQGAWEELQDIIEKQRQSGKNLPYPHFDWYDGWGHNFVESGDFWEAIKRNATRWGYHGGHSDQGLLHYYVKYVRQDASIAIGNRLQTWGKRTGTNKQPRKIRETYNELEKYSGDPVAVQHMCNTAEPEMPEYCTSPYRDFAHFMGSKKPWQYGQKNPFYRRWRSTSKTYQAYQLWFKILAELNEKHNMGLDVKNWDEVHMQEMKDSPLGYKPEFRDNANLINHSEESPNDDSLTKSLRGVDGDESDVIL